MHRVIGERDIEATPFSEATARELFVDMIRARAFDDRALALQRRGWMSGYPPFRGAEASQVAAAHAMRDDDWLFPTYRSNAMQIARGVPMSDILLFRRGFAEFTSDHDVPVFPQAVPIATQIPHAAGAGMAMNYEPADNAVVCYFGDGATSEGDFHEGLNFAGVFDAPVVFFCENNGWAISMPRERQTASESIAIKAEAYGFEGGQVDGNDPLAVREFVGSALERARKGEPVLVESLTYRQGPHTTADDPSVYEDRSQYPEWRTRDPLDRYEEYLLEQGAIDESFREETLEEAKAELTAAVERAEAEPEPSMDEVFDYVYAEPTPNLERQRAWLHDHAARHDIEGVDR
ncbi:thiamine pyrophosphate-dependent dehydrogenase E1 component subunit alpha [Natronomonas sp. EA1]|uniref:thiamine pyrophosphate-dependent dehydrogenase E1 component subunit alpha n=1 Tax=Natronomonas sp. EA1 TaxID=3421655 RepID=UPI003EC0A548